MLNIAKLLNFGPLKSLTLFSFELMSNGVPVKNIRLPAFHIFKVSKFIIAIFCHLQFVPCPLRQPYLCWQLIYSFTNVSRFTSDPHNFGIIFRCSLQTLTSLERSKSFWQKICAKLLDLLRGLSMGKGLIYPLYWTTVFCLWPFVSMKPCLLFIALWSGSDEDLFEEKKELVMKEIENAYRLYNCNRWPIFP